MLHGDQLRIGCGKHGRDFIAREKRKEANVGNIRGGPLKALAFSTVTYEYQADVFCRELPRAFQKRVPRSVKAQVAGMQQDELKIATNGANYLGVRRGRICRSEFGAVPDDEHAFRVRS